MSANHFLFWSALGSLVLGFLPLHEAVRRIVPEAGSRRPWAMMFIDFLKGCLFVAFLRFWWTAQAMDLFAVQISWHHEALEWFLAFVFLLGYYLSPLFRTSQDHGLWIFSGVWLVLSEVAGLAFLITYFVFIKEKKGRPLALMAGLFALLITFLITRSFGYYLINAAGMLFLFLFSHESELDDLLKS